MDHGSAPLIVVGCAVLVEAAMRFHPFWLSSAAHLYVLATSGLPSALLPLATFLVLWLVMRARRSRSGLGTGRQGYGVVVLVTLALLVLAPVVTFFLGPLLVIGLGLVVLGWRGRDRALWVTGLVLGVVSPLAALYTFENRARFLGPAPTSLVLVLSALTILSLGIWRLRAERSVLAQTPAP
ncbi:hypothetical protein [Actinotalea sp. K2]|uniref:hypothetical protein n=1 Tax=Actinotalea sp. K2 TaxID=2939438 RepID=UPI002016D2F0|nr:hypothetical protein [Actinotalea sp. K2]MCL3861729.1 hypothetical protein [Actinotalea sp. K2]